MAVKTLYIKNAVAGTSQFGSLQDGGSAPSTATTTTGWITSRGVLNNTSLFDYGAKLAANTFSATVYPNAAPTNATGDAFRTENTLSGTFAATTWAMSFSVIATTANTNTMRFRIRVWASTNQDGSSARELTTPGSPLLTSSTTANLSTSVAQSITLAGTGGSGNWNPGAVTLQNEYLFVQLACEITLRGSTGTSQDIVLRTDGTNSTITTPDFTAGTTYNDSLTEPATPTTSDSQSSAFVAVNSLTEAASAGSTEDSTVVFADSFTEPASTSDSQEYLLVSDVSLTETAGLGDALDYEYVPGPTGTTYQDELTEPVSVSDSTPAAQLVTSGSVSEAIATTDPLLSSVEGNASLEETVSISDEVARTGDVFAATVTEVAAASDTIENRIAVVIRFETATQTVYRTVFVADEVSQVSEAVSAADACASTLVSSVSLAEQVTAADALGSTVVFRPSVVETASLSDNPSGEGLFNGSVPEPVVAGDVLAPAAVLPVSISEQASSNAAQSVSAVFGSPISEPVAAAEATTGDSGNNVFLTESLAAAETVASIAVLGAAAAESVSASDSVGYALTHGASVSESAAIGAAQTAAQTFASAVAEPVGVSEALIGDSGNDVSIFEAASVSDAPGSTWLTTAAVQESASLEASVSGGSGINVSVSESGTATAAPVASLAVPVSRVEPVTAQGTSTSILSAAAAAVEAVSCSDAAAAIIVSAVSSITETVALSSSEAVLSDTDSSVQESVSVSSSCESQVIFGSQIVEPSLVSDATTVGTVISVNLAEPAAGADALSSVQLFASSIQEALNIFDKFGGAEHSDDLVERAATRDVVHGYRGRRRGEVPKAAAAMVNLLSSPDQLGVSVNTPPPDPTKPHAPAGSASSVLERASRPITPPGDLPMSATVASPDQTKLKTPSAETQPATPGPSPVTIRSIEDESVP